jgi:hypothetical protein
MRPAQRPAHRYPVGVNDHVMQPLPRLERAAERGHPPLQASPTRALTGKRNMVHVIFDCQLVEGVQVPGAHHLSKEPQDGGPVSFAGHRRPPLRAGRCGINWKRRCRPGASRRCTLGLRDDSELLQHLQLLDDMPVLGHPAVTESVDVDAGDSYRPPGWRDAHELRLVCPGVCPVGDHRVTLGNDLMQREEGGKAARIPPTRAFRPSMPCGWPGKGLCSS